MTSRERVIAMINRKPVDRIPVITGSAMVVEYIQKSGGVWPEYHRNAEMMVNAVSMMHTDAGTDNIVMPFGMFISVEYPASLLRGWKTSPRTVNNNTIYQFRFRFVNFCSN